MGRTIIHQDARGLNDDDDDNKNKEVEEGAKYDDSKKSIQSDGNREKSLGTVSPDPSQVTSE
jgi:hypothetical protein